MSILLSGARSDALYAQVQFLFLGFSIPGVGVPAPPFQGQLAITINSTLILSGFLEEEIRDRIGAASRVATLQKPFSMRSLADALWDLLGNDAN